MGGVRTDAISSRDLDVLELIARLGVIPRTVVLEWTGNSDPSNAYRRGRRLMEAGYVVACPRFADSGPVVRITRRGLRACGREELREPRYSDSRVKHALDVGRVGGPALSAATRGAHQRELHLPAGILGCLPRHPPCPTCERILRRLIRRQSEGAKRPYPLRVDGRRDRAILHAGGGGAAR